MTLNAAKIEELMREVYDRLQSIDDAAANAEARRRFAFHMTDCLGDLEALVELYENGEQDKDKAAQKVAGILYHAVPHLNAAGRLLLDHIPDPFERDSLSP